jgi:site-specific DNA-methyltransferase (adenine-specific)
VKHQPFKVHEQVLVFGLSPTTFNKSSRYMKYNPQFTYATPYVMKRDRSDVTNLAGFCGRTDTENTDGKRYPRSVQKFNLERGLHPTQKPVALCEYLIKTYTNEGDTVLDNCMGSGTTGVAALNTNRNFIGIELNEKYFDIAKKRIEEAESDYMFLSRINKDKANFEDLDEKLDYYKQIASMAMELKDNDRIEKELNNLTR